MQKNVIEYLVRTSSLFPKKIAVQDAMEQVCFYDLLQVAYCISLRILSCDIKKSPIGIYIPKGCKAVEAFAGVCMSGNFYVPLDTKSPDSRILSIVNVLDASVIITDKCHYEKLRSFYSKTILVIDEILPLLESQFDSSYVYNLLSSQIDTDPVYSIFTSGSTGTPKGVVVSHRGVIDYIDWAVETFGISNETVIGNQAPFYFDNSTLDIYLMYATGATLNIIPEENFMFPAKLVDYLNEYKITFVFWVPFALINVANFKIFESKLPLYLKDVFFAGEIMPNKHLNYWRKYLPQCRYVNLYGPTEITVDCTYYIVERDFLDDESLPIGFACKNSDVLILVDGREAVVNEQGELCVRGTSLALGYYNDWEKTRKAFIQNPLNSHYPETIYCTGDIVYRNELGEIMYVGRKDSQIKHNGYRIELGEIEMAVLGSHMVENCCVIYNFTLKKIVLFYQSNEDLNMADFRKVIMTYIPKYMMPSEYHRVDMIKQNSNGKIDRLFYNAQVNG
ncbi:AMP-binding protein [Parabacteroides sp. APC149_11_2_Y6]